MFSALYPYLPLDRVASLIQGTSLPTHTSGAALFADISGFTPLTEALVNRLGPKRGAEALTHQLNLIYDVLVNRVHEFGGHVLTFSGDAMTCWFDQHPLNWAGMAYPAPPTERAALCGLHMQADMHAFTQVNVPPDLFIQLGMKVAIAAGPAQRFAVGNPKLQRIDVLAGATLQHMAAVEHLAERGEVLIAAEAAPNLPAHLQPQVWRQADIRAGILPPLPAALTPNTALTPSLAPNADQIDLLKQWILPPIVNRLLAGAAHYLAEMRPASILFLRFSGIDYDHDRAAADKLDQYIRWVQQVLSRYDTFVLQLTVGDKGSYLYSAFGAPIAHDDDTERAILAALELQAAPPTLAYIPAPQIGISQGRIYAGAYGSNTRKTYGVLGDEVNLAARLMDKAAAGQILVSQRVQQALHKHAAPDHAPAYALSALGVIAVKGKKEPLNIWEVRSVSPAFATRQPQAATPPIGDIGRSAELAQLQAWHTLAQHSGQVVLVEGAAGVGKSTLLRRFASHTTALPHQLSGTCPGLGQNSAYAPWRDMLLAWLGLAPHLPAAALAAQLDDYVRQHHPDWRLHLPLLGDLLSLPIADNEITRHYDPQVRQRALFSFVGEWLKHLASHSPPAHPLQLVIHDAHHLDDASAQLLQTVARIVPSLPLLLIISTRPIHPVPSWAQSLQTLPHVHRLTLGAFDLAHCGTLCAQQLGAPCASALVNFIFERTQGNAFYIRELLDVLMQTHSIALNNHVWQLLPAAHSLPLPDSIQGMILARVDRTPEHGKATLKNASAIGFQFEHIILSALHSPNHPPIETQLPDLTAQDFIRPSPQPDHTQFRDAVIQEVIYETLLEFQQRQLHFSIGRGLRQHRPSDLERLAHHTFLGQDWSLALHYQTQAGEQAKRRFLNQRAIGHFERALHCAGQLEPHINGDEITAASLRLRLNLGELCVSTSQYDAAAEHLQHALSLAKTQGNLEAETRACRWLARLCELRGDYAQNLVWFERGLALAQTAVQPSLGLRLEMAELLLQAAMIYLRQGQQAKVAEICEQALHIAEQLAPYADAAASADQHPSATIARTYNLLGHVDLALGKATSAIPHFQHSLRLYQAISHLSGQALALNQLARAYIALGQLEASIAPAQQARALFVQLGDDYHGALVDNNLGEVARTLNRPDEAIEAYQKALRTMQQIGASQWVVGALNNNIGAALIQKREIALAREHLNTAQGIFAEANLRDFLPELWRLFADASLTAGEWQRAIGEAEQGLTHARDLQQRAEEAHILRILGEAWLKLGEIAQAKTLLGLSYAAHHEMGNAAEAARVAGLLAGKD
ncbi:MAG: AAA family ATPase [Anaerolineae bacterium]|nr:AAA family ATPase [Anaerolineae bacterium]